MLARLNGAVAVKDDCRLANAEVRAYGDRSVVTPVPDKTPLTVILFADMLVVVNIFAW